MNNLPPLLNLSVSDAASPAVRVSGVSGFTAAAFAQKMTKLTQDALPKFSEECFICGKSLTNEPSIEYANAKLTHNFFVGLRHGKCITEALEAAFNLFPDDHILMRGANRDALNKKTGKRARREPIGLALRFEVMRRDQFSCVLCGKTAKDSKLEIDHIIPVAEGGTSAASNLRTLCFECNHGKGAKV